MDRLSSRLADFRRPGRWSGWPMLAALLALALLLASLNVQQAFQAAQEQARQRLQA